MVTECASAVTAFGDAFPKDTAAPRVHCALWTAYLGCFVHSRSVVNVGAGTNEPRRRRLRRRLRSSV